jgi:hypothetical protein
MLTLYCERTAPGLFGEPANTLSNIAFAIAAWACWRLVQGRGSVDRPLQLLVVLIAWIAVGSTLFHMTAERWAQILDVTPIFLFQVLWVWLYIHRVAGLSHRRTLLVLTVFLLAALVGSFNRHILNGALPYAPALVLLATCAIHHRRSGRHAPNALFAAFIYFLGALLFRIIDLDVCAAIPFGSHFLWHLLNALVLYFSTKALALNRQHP